jgi:chemotaxis protein CheD
MPNVDELGVLRVGIGEGAVVNVPQVIRTTGLGSCVGLVLYDPTRQIAGMVHVMLPDEPRHSDYPPPKYALTAVPWLLNEMIRAGASLSRLVAKMAGGAQMFVSTGKTDILRVGPRNIKAIEDALAQRNISIVGSDVGGSIGRTIEMDSVTGILTIKTAMRGIYSI